MYTSQCAVQGRGHVKNGTPCQDKTFSLSCNGVDVIALADGAGSASLSHLGAEFTVHYICQRLTEHFDSYMAAENPQPIKSDLMDGLLSGLSDLAKEYNCLLNSLASTLLFAAVKDGYYLVGHLGDGVIGYTKQGKIHVASAPTNGEFANITLFTTSSHALSSLKLIRGNMQNIDGFVLFSDGSEASLYNKREHCISKAVENTMELTRHWQGEYVSEVLQEGFEKSIRSYTFDDCSIAVMVKPGGFHTLSHSEKCQLLHLPERTPRRILRTYQTIFTSAQKECSLPVIAWKIPLRSRHTRNKLEHLVSLGLAEKKGFRYRSLLRP